jgi:hypothetical protein
MNKKQTVKALESIGYKIEASKSRAVLGAKEKVLIVAGPASTWMRWGKDTRFSVYGSNAVIASIAAKEIAAVVGRSVSWHQNELRSLTGYAQPDGRLTKLS